MKENSHSKRRYLVEKTSVINAPPGDIFKILMNFEQWNQWTASITKMSILNNDRPEVGARIKILQPKLPPAIWTITETLQDKSLTWEKSSFGLVMLSEHVITTSNSGTSVIIRMTYQGPLASLFYMLTHSLTDRYMTMEIYGLKRECEKK
jgi:uncharacterized membrane protein